MTRTTKGYAYLPSGPDLDTSWKSRGACVGSDVELFFGERGDGMGEAKAMCARCPVRVECLEYALAAREVHGCWGGTSERERRKIRAARRRRKRVA